MVVTYALESGEVIERDFSHLLESNVQNAARAAAQEILADYDSSLCVYDVYGKTFTATRDE